MYVEIEVKINNYMTKEWSFWFDDRSATLFLDIYRILERKTTRGRFSISKQYSRLDRRNNTIVLDEIDIPDDVKKAVMDNFISQIRIAKWK